MSNSIFYGTEESSTFTYLEFGEINMDSGRKAVWDFRLHQQAYDWLMLSRYANDILAYHKMEPLVDAGDDSAACELYAQEVHHEDDASVSLAKLIGLAVTQQEGKPSSLYELGQTLFGCIDGMELYQQWLQRLEVPLTHVPLKDVVWYGVDISEMFNELSVLMHQDYTVNTMTDPADLPGQLDVFFSKGVTLLYAVRDLNQLFETLETGRIAVFDYSFTFSDGEDTTIGSGKTVRYLNLVAFLEQLETKERILYVKTQTSRVDPKTGRVWLDCVYAEPSFVDAFTVLDTKVRREFAKKLSGIKQSDRFVNNDHEPEWVPVHQFLKTHKVVG
jgi:hypothetical protein